MSDVLDYVREKEPAFKAVPDDVLTEYVADRQPEFLNRSKSFSSDYQKIVSTKPGGSLTGAESGVTLPSPKPAPDQAPAIPKGTFPPSPFDGLTPEQIQTHEEKAGQPLYELVKPLSDEERAKLSPTQLGVFESIRENANALTKPENLDLLALGGGIAKLGTVAARAVAGAFAVMMGKEVPHMAAELGSELGKPKDKQDPEKIAKLISDGVIATGFTGMTAAHAAGGIGPALGDRPVTDLTKFDTVKFTPLQAESEKVAAAGAPATAQALAEVGQSVQAKTEPVISHEPAPVPVPAPAPTPPSPDLAPASKAASEAATRLRQAMQVKEAEAEKPVKGPERGLPETATESDLMSDMTEAGRKAFKEAKAKPDEFSAVDVTDLSDADRRNLARLGLSFSEDRQRRIMATYPARLRAEDLRKAVQAKQPTPAPVEEAKPETKPKEKGPENASSQRPSEEIHGDLQPRPVEGKGQVPVDESGEGVQSQTEGGLPKAPEPKPSTEQDVKPAPSKTDPRLMTDEAIADEIKSNDESASPHHAKLDSIPEDRLLKKSGSYSTEAQAIVDKIKPYSERNESLRNEAKRRSDEKQNKANMEARDKRVAEAKVFQKRNGWEIVKEGVDYVLRHPESKEDIYRGKLSRVREVADESKPEPSTPPAPAPKPAEGGAGEVDEPKKPADDIPVNERFQETDRGRSVYKADLALENAKDEAVIKAIKSVPSYPKLLAAYHRFRKSLYGKGYDPTVIEKTPWDMLDSSSGVMNAKSQMAKTLSSLEDAVFKESGLPRKKPSSRFRGGTGVDWEKVQPEQSIPESTQSQSEAKAIADKQQQGFTGMGGAVPSEFEGGDQKYVSNMFAAIDRDRVAMGKPPMPDTERRTWDQDNAKALAQMNRDPNWVPNLIAEVLKKPRPLLSWENAGLVWHRQKITAELNNALSRIAQAFDDNRTEDLADAKVSAAVFEDQLEELDRAVGRNGTGSEAGRTLQAQKMGAGDDFSLIEMRLRKRAAVGGRPLTDAESNQIAKLHEQISEAEKAHKEEVLSRDQRIAEMEVKAALDKLERESRPSYSKAVLEHAEKFAQFMDKKGSEALDRLRKRRAEGRLTAGIDPTDLVDLSTYGASKITRGLAEFGKWSAHMIDAAGDWVKPYLDEIWKASLKVQSDELSKLEKNLSKPVVEGVKRVSKKVDVLDRKANIQKKIQDKVDSGKRNEIASMVNKLCRELIDSGVHGRDNLIDAVHAVLKEVDPTFTRRETMDAISGYGDFKQLSKDQISVELRDLKRQMQEVAKLEDMEAGQPPLKTGIERAEVTREQSRLIKLVNEAKRKFQVPISDPSTQLKSSLDTLKTRMTNRIEELNQKMADKDFTTKPKRDIQLDTTAVRLKANYERVKKKYQEMLVADRLKNRTQWEKTMDLGTKYRRFGVLSSPVVIPKLISAGIQRLGTLPLEEEIGGALSKLPGIKQVSALAPTEGGGRNLKAEMRGYGAALTKGMKDAYSVLRKGHSDLDVIYGKAGESYTGEFEMMSKALSLPGRIHGMIKAPVKRAVFERTVQRLGEFYSKQGLDPADEIVQARIMTEAYKKANEAIFLQDNRVASAMNAALHRLEQPDKATGKPTVGGKIGATVGHVLFPIVRVPLNIIGETMQYAAGSVTGSARLANALRKGVENLKPEQADLIMRELKKGSIGAAVLALGYFNADMIGGYYQPGKKQKPKDVKYGSIRVAGVDIPSFLLHNPLLETLQIGATLRHVAESKLRKKDKEAQGLTAGTMAAAMGVVEQVPFMREQQELGKLMNPYTRGSFLAEQSRSLAVPAVVQKTAEWTDRDKHGNPIKRKPTTVMEGIKSGIPGLRQDVPVAKQQPTQ